MQRNILLSVAVCFVVASIATAAASWLTRPEEDFGLVATEPILRLGQVTQTTLNETFELTNRSPEPIQILKFRKQCDCTEASLSTTELAPGETAELTCEWDTRGQRGKTTSTLLLLYGRTETRRKHSLLLTFEAVIVPEFTFSPAKLEFFEDEECSKTIRFETGRPEGLALSNVNCSQRAFEASLVEGENGSPVIEVAFDPALWGGDDRSFDLIAETNVEGEPRIRIPLFVVKPE